MISSYNRLAFSLFSNTRIAKSKSLLLFSSNHIALIFKQQQQQEQRRTIILSFDDESLTNNYTDNNNSNCQYQRQQQQKQRYNKLIQSTNNWITNIVIGEKLCPFVAPLIVGDNDTANKDTTNEVNDDTKYVQKGTNKIRIIVSTALNETEVINDIINELDILLNRPPVPTSSTRTKDSSTEVQQYYSHETTLIVFDSKFESSSVDDNDRMIHDTALTVNDNTNTTTIFDNYYDFVRLSWEIQSKAIIEKGYENDVQIVLFHPNAVHQTYNSNNTESASDYTIRSPYPTIHLLRQMDVIRAVESGKYPNLQHLPTRNQNKLYKLGYDICQQRLLDCYEEKNADGC